MLIMSNLFFWILCIIAYVILHYIHVEWCRWCIAVYQVISFVSFSFWVLLVTTPHHTTDHTVLPVAATFAEISHCMEICLHEHTIFDEKFIFPPIFVFRKDSLFGITISTKSDSSQKHEKMFFRTSIRRKELLFEIWTKI